MRRVTFIVLFPVMALVVNPLQELLTWLREWWESL